jgi:serine/threonine protein phosphatase 1
VGFLALRRKRRPRLLPEGVRIYAIGDVHGRADLLDQLFKRIDAHIAAHPVVRPIHVLVGDYIDRGPNSRGVLDRLILRGRAHEMVSLKGNHETLVLEFLRDPLMLESWSQLGGLETLMSYGLTPSLNTNAVARQELASALRAVLPKPHLNFLGTLPLSFSCGGYFFVHAGVRPRIPLDQQREEDLLWIRNEFLLYEEEFGKIIVHGHTPVRDIDIRSNRINIDTGAYATGKLSCLVMEDEFFEPL